MNTIDSIKNSIDKIEDIYGVNVGLKLRLQFENCLNCEWYYDDLNETLFCEDFGLSSDDLNDVREVQYLILQFFGVER
jgi:hypothetical protein